MSVDLSQVKKIYFIGIKGVAMSGLAVICRQRGMEVFGSDVSEKFVTDKVLAVTGITIFDTFDAENLACNPDLVVIGTSWGDDNVEVAVTKARGIPWMTDSEMRGLLSSEKRTIAVAGVHGKTTTTALLAHIFAVAGLDPSYLVGTGSVPNLGGNARWAAGKHFIVEGDEYVRSKTELIPKFLDLQPAISIITSIEWEHVDIYPSVAAIEVPFTELVKKTSELVVACGDWESIRKVIAAEPKKVATYGLGENNLWRAVDIQTEYDKTIFHVQNHAGTFGVFSVPLFGVHNVMNALAVIITATREGIGVDKIQRGLESFHGAERRFDVSEKNGVIFVDDYAHHPTAVKTTLQAIRHRYPDRKIWCVFQPHMASRTKALLSEFSQSFSDVDAVLFADIFASAREHASDITSQQLTEETKKYQPAAQYTGDLNQTIAYLKEHITPRMVIVTMGAGDVYRVRDKLLSVV